MARRTTGLGIFLVSAATLLFELALTRLFAVAEWHHYAFLAVSVALLGNAMSGTLTALLSPIWLRRLDRCAASALPVSVVASYLVLDHLSFDAYQLAWDTHQFAYLLIDYLALVLPFGLSGYLLVRAIGNDAARSHLRYGANLLGGALGGAAMMALLPLVGERVVLIVAIVGAQGGLLLRLGEEPTATAARGRAWLFAVLSCVVCVALLWLRPSWVTLRVSPYKGLSQALRAQGATPLYQAWNGYSRVDVIASPSLHSAPGLSLAFDGTLPPQLGLLVDADDLSPLAQRASAADEAYLAYLPEALAYRLRPAARALILSPRGGTQVALALHEGAQSVVAVQDNALVLNIVCDRYSAYLGGLYRDSRVAVLSASGRSGLLRAAGPFDLVVLPLAAPYYPLTVGAYALSENYVYTVEGLSAALAQLDGDGVLVVTRWAQDPPAEALRAAALLVQALGRRGVDDPAAHLIAFRTWNTVTLLASPAPFTTQDVALVRDGCAALGWDLAHYAGMPSTEAGRAIVTSGPTEHDLFEALFAAAEGGSTGLGRFYSTQRYNVSPPTDDRPFFDHYFRWGQLGSIISGLGRTWQPFGGSGYLLVLALLAIAIVLAAVLTMLAFVAARPCTMASMAYRRRALAYFVLVGVGYMLVEMPLLQQFILYLDHPARAFTVVLSTLLCCSGLGSLLAGRVPLRVALLVLGIVVMLSGLLVRPLAQQTLHWSLEARVAAAIAWLAPLGLLMGLPFGGGLRRLGEAAPSAMPWVWAANGGASVVSSILATVLALEVGYRAVLGLGAACYLVAALCLWPVVRPSRA